MLMKKTGFLFFCLCLMVCVSRSTAMERVTVRDGMFVYADSGRPFVFWGANHCELDKWHAVFSVGMYSPERAEKLLAELKDNGLNPVRIFLDCRPGRPNEHGSPGIGGLGEGPELNPEYMANVIDWLERARKHGIYTILTLDNIPIAPYYEALRDQPAPPMVGDCIDHPRGHPVNKGGNRQFFDERLVNAKAEYGRQVVKTIKVHDPSLLKAVLAYELDNEARFIAKTEPFTLHEGVFEYRGESYNLSNDRQVLALADAAAVHWADTAAAVIRSEDPDALVSVNMFTHHMVGREDVLSVREEQGAAWDRRGRLPLRPLALMDSSLDYIDLHIYMHHIGREGSVEQVIRSNFKSIEMDALQAASLRTGKALVLGEFAAHYDKERDLEQKIEDVRVQVKMCLDAGFRGFLYWTYVSDKQPKIIHLKDRGGEMLAAYLQMKGQLQDRLNEESGK